MSGFVMAIVQLWLEIPAVIGYIRGQAFQRPLSKEEEAACLQRLAEGDEDARDELIERNMRLVAHIVKKFHPKHELLDDYISIGTIGLMKAVNSFTPDRKTKLATYAARCIENEILMYLRTQKKVQKDVSLFDPIGMDKDGQSLQIADLLQTDDDPQSMQSNKKKEKKDCTDILESLMAENLKSFKDDMVCLDDLPMTQKEIAEQLDISRSYVSRIEKRAIVKLYQLFKHEYNDLN